jgi:hypothetical protein
MPKPKAPPKPPPPVEKPELMLEEPDGRKLKRRGSDLPLAQADKRAAATGATPSGLTI